MPGDQTKFPKPWFSNDDHALATGFLIGTLVKAGIPCNMVRDDFGNYKPFIQIVIPEEGEVEPFRVTVQVMPAGARAGGAQDE